MASAPQPVSIMRYLGPLTFDAVFEEDHTAELTITDNPVESGVTVSDHAYMAPLKVTIRAGVSDTPLSAPSDDLYGSGTSRAQEAYRLLRELQKKAEPFDVQTGLCLYKNMVVETIRAGQDKDTAHALLFEADLREVIIVSTQAVTYPPRKAGATKHQASKQQDKGEQQGKDVTKDTSVLKSLKNFVTGG